MKDKKKKRILKEFKLTEISAVDKPAQSPALVTIMKRFDEPIEKKYVMTSATDGHTHLVSINIWSKDDMGGYTSWTDNHEHPFILRDDGSIEVGEANGHTHGVFPSTEQIFQKGITDAQLEPILALMKTTFKKPNAADIGGNKPVHLPETTMPEITKADHDTALNRIEVLTKSLAAAIAIGLLSDEHKAHHASLSVTDQESFLGKSAGERNGVLEAIQKADAVVYTAEDGTEFRKSDDARLVSMAKRADEADKDLAKSRLASDQLQFEKRAATEFVNLPGEVPAQVALLKAVAGIEDKDSRESVEALLKTHNANLSVVTSTLGTQAISKASGDAGGELDRLAKAHVSANPEISYYDAYDLVGVANPELLNRAVSG